LIEDFFLVLEAEVPFLGEVYYWSSRYVGNHARVCVCCVRVSVLDPDGRWNIL
jgi:hypothetical protein